MQEDRHHLPKRKLQLHRLALVAYALLLPVEDASKGFSPFSSKLL